MSKINFEELQADFYHYMINDGGITKKTSGDYVSRLKFLTKFYHIDENITKDYSEMFITQNML